MNLQNVAFIRSAASVSDCPRDGLPQIAFAGRSNVGKSSVINRLLGRRGMARVSASPGKTAEINYFRAEGFYLVDLPGYGFAKVSQAERQRWATLMEAYFSSELLTFGIFVVDARHRPTELDLVMENWFKETEKPHVIVANKLDKLKKSQIEKNLFDIRADLALEDDVAVIPFSAETGVGREKLVQVIMSAAQRSWGR